MLLLLLQLPSVCHSRFHSTVQFYKHDFQCIPLCLFLSFHLPILFLNLFAVFTWILCFFIPSSMPLASFNYRTVSFWYVRVCYLCLFMRLWVIRIAQDNVPGGTPTWLSCRTYWTEAWFSWLFLPRNRFLLGFVSPTIIHCNHVTKIK